MKCPIGETCAVCHPELILSARPMDPDPEYPWLERRRFGEPLAYGLFQVVPSTWREQQQSSKLDAQENHGK